MYKTSNVLAVDRKRHKNKFNLIDVDKMSTKEKIKLKTIENAFYIKQSDGKPEMGKKFKTYQRIISLRNIIALRNAIQTEPHWPTQAMLIRNLALVKYKKNNAN